MEEAVSFNHVPISTLCPDQCLNERVGGDDEAMVCWNYKLDWCPFLNTQ